MCSTRPLSVSKSGRDIGALIRIRERISVLPPEGKRSEAYLSRNLVNSELNVYKEERERERERGGGRLLYITSDKYFLYYLECSFDVSSPFKKISNSVSNTSHSTDLQ